jgi:hypothetical protein
MQVKAVIRIKKLEKNGVARPEDKFAEAIQALVEKERAKKRLLGRLEEAAKSVVSQTKEHASVMMQKIHHNDVAWEGKEIQALAAEFRGVDRHNRGYITQADLVKIQCRRAYQARKKEHKLMSSKPFDCPQKLLNADRTISRSMAEQAFTKLNRTRMNFEQFCDATKITNELAHELGVSAPPEFEGGFLGPPEPTQPSGGVISMLKRTASAKFAFPLLNPIHDSDDRSVGQSPTNSPMGKSSSWDTFRISSSSTNLNIFNWKKKGAGAEPQASVDLLSGQEFPTLPSSKRGPFFWKPTFSGKDIARRINKYKGNADSSESCSSGSRSRSMPP